MNWYAYVAGNPVSFLDPFGLEKTISTGTEEAHIIISNISYTLACINIAIPNVVILFATTIVNGFDIGLYVYDLTQYDPLSDEAATTWGNIGKDIAGFIPIMGDYYTIGMFLKGKYDKGNYKMNYRRYDKQLKIFAVNTIILTYQVIALTFFQDDYLMKGIGAGLIILIVCPIIIYSVLEVKRWNYLVENGRVVITKIISDETKVIFGVGNTVIMQIQSVLLENNITYIFKGEFETSVYDMKKIKNIINERETINVMVDKTFKQYRFLFDQILQGTYRDTYVECPAVLNYLGLILNLVLLILNLIQLLF